MAPSMSLATRSASAGPHVDTSSLPLVPTTRTVASLAAALGAVRRLGGSVTSEIRMVPGIGSWAFVTEGDGREVVLWEDSSTYRR